MTIDFELMGFPYTLYISKSELYRELEAEGIENVEDYYAWVNHLKRQIFVSNEGSSLDLLFRICHELTHAIGYIQGNKLLRAWTKQGEAATDSIAYVLTQLFMNQEFILTMLQPQVLPEPTTISVQLFGSQFEIEVPTDEPVQKRITESLGEYFNVAVALRGESPKKSVLNPRAWAFAVGSLLKNKELVEYLLELGRQARKQLMS